MESGTTEKYQTPDVYLSSYLILQGYSPELDNQNGRILFQFPASSALYTVIDNYTIGGTVEASRFAAVIRNLKSRLYSARKENGNNGNGRKDHA